MDVVLGDYEYLVTVGFPIFRRAKLKSSHFFPANFEGHSKSILHPEHQTTKTIKKHEGANGRRNGAFS